MKKNTKLQTREFEMTVPTKLDDKKKLIIKLEIAKRTKKFPVLMRSSEKKYWEIQASYFFPVFNL